MAEDWARVVYHLDVHYNERQSARTEGLVQRALDGQIMLALEGVRYSAEAIDVMFNGLMLHVESPFIMGIEDAYTASRCATLIIRELRKLSEQTVTRDLHIDDATRILHMFVAMAALDPEVDLHDLGDTNGDLADVALILRERLTYLDWADIDMLARAAFRQKDGLPPRVNLHKVIQAAKLHLSRAFPLLTTEEAMDYALYTQREKAWVRNIRNVGADGRFSHLELHIIVGGGHLGVLPADFLREFFPDTTQQSFDANARHQRGLPSPRLREMLPGIVAPLFNTWPASV